MYKIPWYVQVENQKLKLVFKQMLPRWRSQPIKYGKQILAHRRTSSKHQFDKSSKRKANCVMRFLKGCLPCSLSPIKISKIVQECNKSTSDLDTRHPKTINCYKVKLFLSQKFQTQTLKKLKNNYFFLIIKCYDKSFCKNVFNTILFYYLLLGFLFI